MYSIKQVVFSLFLLLCWVESSLWGRTPRVLVSVAPYKYFVERIAGNTVDVAVVVPPGVSSHTYEPTPKQMVAFANSDLWFQVGEAFEPGMERALKSQNPKLQVVSLRKGIDLIRAMHGQEHDSHCCGKDMIDLHIWLSPSEVQVQAKTIADTLSERYPTEAFRFQSGLDALLADLQALDDEIQFLLAGDKGKVLFVSHPAYGYYARDYGLEQLSVEFEGKDPTPQQLTALLQRARNANVKVLFVQPQYPSKGARLIADQLDIRVISVDPYSEDYIENLRMLSRLFAGIKQEESQ